MSFISNPLSRHVGFIRYWQNFWAINTWTNYSIITSSDRLLLVYIKFLLLLFKSKKLVWNLKIVSNINKEWFWLWPEFKILRFHNSITLIIFFRSLSYFQPKIKFNTIKNYNFKNFLVLFKTYFINTFILENSQFYIFRLKYLNLLKYIYIYTYWYFFLYNYSNTKTAIISYLTQYFSLKVFNKWLNFYCKQLKYFIKNLISIPIKIFFKIVPFEIINANWLLEFIKLKLSRNYQIRFIVLSIFKQLNTYKKEYGISFYKGLKICVSGRFSRADRKLYWWKSEGFLGHNKLVNWYEYASTTVRLTNSICGLKIWLRKNPFFYNTSNVIL